MDLNFSQFFQQIFNNFPFLVLFILIIILFIWNISLNLQQRKIKKRLQSFFEGKNAKDLEELILESLKRLKKSEKSIQEIYKFLKYLDKISKKSIQKVGIIRYNPFHESGGDQSFAIALLDYHNDGIVISSLYTRQGVSVYSKPIKKGKSIKYPLSDEEQKAIKNAQK